MIVFFFNFENDAKNRIWNSVDFFDITFEVVSYLSQNFPCNFFPWNQQKKQEAKPNEFNEKINQIKKAGAKGK